ncbi:hypothetical protein BZG05_14930 [Salinivibrio kushneri]|nr:hypothetical protein BZG05_14930 [Salinivibrio kushneri]
MTDERCVAIAQEVKGRDKDKIASGNLCIFQMLIKKLLKLSESSIPTPIKNAEIVGMNIASQNQQYFERGTFPFLTLVLTL